VSAKDREILVREALRKVLVRNHIESAVSPESLEKMKSGTCDDIQLVCSDETRIDAITVDSIEHEVGRNVMYELNGKAGFEGLIMPRLEWDMTVGDLVNAFVRWNSTVDD